ncbi:hypothetical protein JCM10212_005327 [Sporobolomyces blumeae]
MQALAPTTTRMKQQYECIECCAPVESLYTTYSQKSNTSLLACPRCLAPAADAYAAVPLEVALLDVVLLKRRVYRHLLRNRGGGQSHHGDRHRLRETARLTGIVLAVDALVRCVPVEYDRDIDAVKLFVLTFGYCLLETVSLFVSVAIAALVVLGCRNRRRVTLNDLSLVPLALLYSSLPTSFFLVIASIIWRREYLPPPASSAGSTIASDGQASGIIDLSPYLTKLDLLRESLLAPPPSFDPLEPSSPSSLPAYSRVSGDRDPRTASTWTSYLVSFSRANLKIVFRTTNKTAVVILGVAWILHLVLLHAIDRVIA